MPQPPRPPCPARPGEASAAAGRNHEHDHEMEMKNALAHGCPLEKTLKFIGARGWGLRRSGREPGAQPWGKLGFIRRHRLGTASWPGSATGRWLQRGHAGDPHGPQHSGTAGEGSPSPGTTGWALQAGRTTSSRGIWGGSSPRPLPGDGVGAVHAGAGGAGSSWGCWFQLGFIAVLCITDRAQFLNRCHRSPRAGWRQSCPGGWRGLGGCRALLGQPWAEPSPCKAKPTGPGGRSQHRAALCSGRSKREKLLLLRGRRMSGVHEEGEQNPQFQGGCAKLGHGRSPPAPSQRLSPMSPAAQGKP